MWYQNQEDTDLDTRPDEWSASDSRVWAAHQGREQFAYQTWLLPAEAELLVADHLALLSNLDDQDAEDPL